MYPSALLVPALAAVALAAPATPEQRSPPLSLPLKHLDSRQYSSDPDAHHAWLESQAAGLRNKYSKHLAGRSLELYKRGQEERLAKRQQTVGSVQLIDLQVDASYAASVGIGTPPQYFDVIMDTGSSDLWIMAEGCTGCDGMTTMDHDKSSTLEESSVGFDVSYGSGDVSGLLASDTVSMAGFSVASQTFGLVNQTTAVGVGSSSDTLIDPPLSGLMGLGWETIANSGATPWWQFLAANVWQDKQFGVFMARFRGQPTVSPIEEEGGEIVFGGVNTSLIQGDINYISIPPNNRDYWRLPIESVQINGQRLSYSSATASAAIDTGTTLIGAPSSVVRQVFSQIPNAASLTDQGMQGYYMYPCSQTVEFALGFGGRVYYINNNDFNLGPAFPGSSRWCVGALFEVQTSSHSPIDWIVGASFLKNVYSTYRYNPTAIGFADLAPGVQRTGGNTQISTADNGLAGGGGGAGKSSGSGFNAASPRATYNCAAVALVAVSIIATFFF